MKHKQQRKTKQNKKFERSNEPWVWLILLTIYFAVWTCLLSWSIGFLFDFVLNYHFSCSKAISKCYRGGKRIKNWIGEGVSQPILNWYNFIQLNLNLLYIFIHVARNSKRSLLCLHDTINLCPPKFGEPQKDIRPEKKKRFSSKRPYRLNLLTLFHLFQIIFCFLHKIVHCVCLPARPRWACFSIGICDHSSGTYKKKREPNA